MNREAKFNILRGCVIGSYLDRKEKEEILEFVRELEQPQADKWIPCEERLPVGKETDKILVTDKDGIMAV